MSREPSDPPVRSLRGLSTDATPARDLWPDIQAQLAPRRRRWMVPASLAAGLLVAAIGVIIGMQVRPLQQPGMEQASGSFLQAALMTDPAYLQRREALRQQLPARLERLPPASRQRVIESLAAIQDAMRTLEAELGRDAGNAILQELFIATCQEEMRVLTAVDSLGGYTEEI